MTSVKVPGSGTIILWSEKAALFGVPPLMSQQLSFKPGYILQVGLTFPLELVLFL